MSSERTFGVRQYDESSLLIDLCRGREPTEIRMVIRGDLDAVSADRLCVCVCDVLRRQRPTRITVDLRGVAFVDSAGIRALLRCRDQADAAHTSFILAETPATIVRVLEITGLAAHFGLTHRPEPGA